MNRLGQAFDFYSTSSFSRINIELALILEGWSMKCFEDWKSYLRLAIPGFGMLLFEWANFEIGVIFSGRFCFLFAF
jgi:hypothetical protein